MVRNTIALPAKSNKDWNERLPELLEEAVEQYSLTDRPEWSELDVLSSRTQFDGMKVFSEHSVVENGRFFAPANVYVRLNYGSKGDESTTTDVYPAKVHFRIEDGAKVLIDRVEVDTSSFFE